MISDAPRSLRDPAEVVRRWSRLGEPRMAPLLDLVARIRAERGHTPFPDPLDGGAEARFLLLLETPGPSVGRTGLVSRDNVNGTAANLWRFLDAACIPRAETLIWNDAAQALIHGYRPAGFDLGQIRYVLGQAAPDPPGNSMEPSDA